MQVWFQFYAVAAGASAALLGLLFVAVSMNAHAILGGDHATARRLAEQAFQNYLAVLLVSLLALFPGMSIADFAIAALTATVVQAGWVLWRVCVALVGALERGSRSYALRRHLTSLIGFTIVLGAGVDMIVTREDHRGWIGAGMMVLLLSATTVSWELLVRLAKGEAG